MCCCSFHVRAQDPIVEDIINSMSIDSMMKYVRQLSGEATVDIGNGPEMIMSRHTNNPGNEKAQLFLVQKLEEFGYVPTIQSFSTTGKNVIITKAGTIAGTDPVILCAHYDAMPGGIYNAPGADDDGSGTAAVLEAARILADVQFEHPIIFALWDEEEQGLVGSGFYAGGIAANDVELRAVINMDAIAYDGNGDTQARIHSRPIGNSHEIADSVFAMRDHYNIDLDLILTVPGAGYSDHASFWNENYGAILVIEEFSADGNPFYHTVNDRTEYFDVPYFEKLARLSLATLATLAVPVESGTGISTGERNTIALQAFPNPSSGDINIWFTSENTGPVTITLLDAVGREVLKIHEGTLSNGKHAFTVPMAALPSGTYHVKASDNRSTKTLRLVRIS